MWPACDSGCGFAGASCARSCDAAQKIMVQMQIPEKSSLGVLQTSCKIMHHGLIMSFYSICMSAELCFLFVIVDSSALKLCDFAGGQDTHCAHIDNNKQGNPKVPLVEQETTNAGFLDIACQR